MSVPTHQLMVGELIVSDEPCVIATTLGSCVSVALFSDDGVGGLIHYAHPRAPADVTDEDAFRYGDFALPTLIEEIIRRTGDQPARLHAKIVGGADVRGEAPTAGPANVRFAREYLASRGISVVGEATGGPLGRRVLFHTDGGRLQVAPIAPIAAAVATSPAATLARPRRVLIVDDSKTIRDLLSRVLNEDPELEIIGQAADAIEAEAMLNRLNPDVITLDIHMPKMTGTEWLERLLPRRPIPVVMISSLQMQEGNEVFRALELGAVDYIQKPSLAELPILGPLIREKVKAASAAKVRRRSRPSARLQTAPFDSRAVICIGASTGGTEALTDVLCGLPDEIPPVLIVQHIPPVFSKTFADRLNQLCPFEVKEAEDGDEVCANRVLVAPGGRQMRIENSPAGYRVRITDDAPVNRHKPSVDYLFNSVARVVTHKSVAVILTGMGADGAKGLLELRRTGWFTIGQDEASSVVYGMPKAAFEMGAVQKVASLAQVAREIVGAWSFRKSA